MDAEVCSAKPNIPTGKPVGISSSEFTATEKSRCLTQRPFRFPTTHWTQSMKQNPTGLAGGSFANGQRGIRDEPPPLKLFFTVLQ
jgi:hypothetical protein